MFLVLKRALFLNKFGNNCNFNKFSTMSSLKCIFCKIIQNELPAEICFENDEIVVFKDIKPATKFHYLAVPKEHIINVNSLSTPDHKGLLERLIENGKKVIEKKGGDVNDIQLGFHLPPFNSISHLHLHVIYPASQMSFISRMIFKPNTWWFASADQIIEKLRTQTPIGNKL